MYGQIFTPNEQNGSIHFEIPREWYGQSVEFIAFPVLNSNAQSQQKATVQERRKKREELLNRYSIDLSDFRFNRDEANDYE